MKLKYLPLLLIGFLVISCQENQPEYTLIRPETGDRMVIVEEFSGARCPNCPQGTQELENLNQVYGDRLVIITIHAGDFAFTYNDSKFDFTTPEGDALLAFLGNPIGYPSAVINRIKDQSSQSFQLFSTKWGGLISEALTVPPAVAITINQMFDTGTRNLVANVRVVPNETMDTELRLTVLLKEDNIIDPQADRADPSGVVTQYNHRNVLRRVLSDVKGDLIASDPVAFEAVESTYTYLLPEEMGWWKLEDLTLVAFVSAGTGEILQGAQTSIAQ
ncbi:MAG: Omp28-related outer membrane protein [Saprospiraceae bacterium]|nr:Omp28-related outer membrane protein [Saprospiraceae bacterium]